MKFKIAFVMHKYFKLTFLFPADLANISEPYGDRNEKEKRFEISRSKNEFFVKGSFSKQCKEAAILSVQICTKFEFEEKQFSL